MGKGAIGVMLLTLASFIWGSSFAAQSIGMEYVEPATFNAARFFVGALSLLPVIWARSVWAKRAGLFAEPLARLESGKLLKAGLLCGAALFIGATLQQMGIVYTSVGKAGFITALYIIIVPILGLFMGKKAAPRMWGCAAAAMAGLYFLCGVDPSALNKGDVMVLACAFLFSAHILLIDHFSPLVDGVKLSCLQFLTSGVLSLILAFMTEQPTLYGIWGARMPILFTGVLSCGVAYTLQIVGQKNVNPALASLVMSLESVFSAIAGWAVLGEVLSAREISGCAMIFAAIIFANGPVKKRKKTSGCSLEQPDS
ncbi:MAG: DMT family transporter [Synergistaceae bacterium]|jgi:drug/metabolite transporter (DMT)-like permease|nr:DMT family transporter [Synergistaceae bacterium]